MAAAIDPGNLFSILKIARDNLKVPIFKSLADGRDIKQAIGWAISSNDK